MQKKEVKKTKQTNQMNQTEKSIDFSAIEKRWQQRWQKSRIFEAKEGKGRKFYVLEMFAYPSAMGLHMGHAFNYTLGDIYARFKRMNGFNVLYPFGYDSLGLPAENAAIKEGVHPKKYTEKAISNFIKQQKELGLSYDWSRLFATHDPLYYKWDQWIFLKMFEKGIAYRKKASVNYCPKCQTVLANEQVHDGKCWRHKDTEVQIKQLEQWFFKTTEYAEELYDNLDKLIGWPEDIKIMQKNWIGKSHGVEIDFIIESVKKVVLIHGKSATPKDKWYPWLINQINKKNIEALAPELPDPKDPEIGKWLEKIEETKPDGNTVLVGHSRGCAAILRWLEKLPKDKKVKKVILVGTNSGNSLKMNKTENNKGFYTKEGYDFEKIKSHCKNFVVIHSKDDPVVPFSAGEENAKGLDAKFKVYEDKKHFEIKESSQIPEVLEEVFEKWPVFTTRPDTIYGVTFMVVSAQHPKLFELVKGTKQEKQVKKFVEKHKGIKQEDIDKMDKEGVFTGKYAVNPINNEKIPVYAGNFVLADYGSGMVMAVPAHDQRDFEFAKKYGLPIKGVIRPKKSHYCIIEKSLPKDKINELNKFGEIKIEKEIKEWGKFIIVYPAVKKEKELIAFLKKNLLKKSKEAVGWYSNSQDIVIFNGKIIPTSTSEGVEEFKKYGRNLGIPENQLDLNVDCYTDEGILVNSAQFDGLNNIDAIKKISEYAEKNKFGKRTINYRLKDWLISRQRYWGTPIPIVYCDKCGIVSVPEKDLPVKLPEKVTFGKGNPLATSKEFVNVKCPKCNGPARRETDTMDTFVNSSWYFLRYCDPKNNKEIFDKKKAAYWMPIDMYIGGKEHACMHLIYFRFYTKFLRDLGLLKIDEPVVNLFNQGMLHGLDGAVMSKSRGNVVLPQEVSKKFGIDTARLFLVSLASADKDIMWSEKGIEGTSRFIKKVVDYFSALKFGKTSARLESKVNKTIKGVTQDVDGFKYNFAVIKIRSLFDYFSSDKVDKKTSEVFLKLLNPFCPHITEELWHGLGNKSFVSIEKWPVCDEKKINIEFEKQEEAQEKLKQDLNHILKILIGKGGKPKKIFIYTLPGELGLYVMNKVKLSKALNLFVEIYAVNDKKKYDPMGKAGKAKPGKPAIYVE